jgi:type IV pilus assembly protein PilC
MPSFSYVAFDRRGAETKGALTVDTLTDALRVIREMGYFPTKVIPGDSPRPALRATTAVSRSKRKASWEILPARVGFRSLVVFTRQMATLLEAGMPLLRGLRLIRQQESNKALRRTVEQLADAIEGGASISEAMSQHPRTFNRLYLQMVRAGELSGALEVVLRRLAELMEKAQRIKNKVISALFYPIAVLSVAIAVLGVLVVFVVPRFNEIFAGLLNGRPLPAFTQFVMGLSLYAKNHLIFMLSTIAVLVASVVFLGRTRPGRAVLDRVKLGLPLFGELIRKTAVVRFTRTLGTLTSNGVPILQALQIVRDTTGNVVVSKAVQAVHDSVADGETITTPLRTSGVFPALVTGMVDIGEQTGALPEMLSKIADTYEDEVDHTVAAMTSLLEPVMIVFLAVIVGSIVIALFLPLVDAAINFDGGGAGRVDG